MFKGSEKMKEELDSCYSGSMFAWQIMVLPLTTLQPDQPLIEAVHDLARYRIPVAPVLDDAGKLLGIISGQQVISRLAEGMPFDQEVSSVMEHNNYYIISRDEVVPSGRMYEAGFVYDKGELVGVIYPENYLKACQWKNELHKSFENLSREYEMTLNNCYDSIYSTDGLGNVLWVNPATERIINRNPSEVLGKNVNELEREQAFYPSVTNLVLKYMKPMTIIQEVDQGKKVIVTGCPVFDENNKIIRVISITRDVSELIKDIEEFTRSSGLVDVFNRLKNAENLAERYYSELRELRKDRLAKNQVIARSKEMINIMELAKKVASVDSTILLLGESGVGKDVIATLIHELSDRREGPYIKINCGAIPDSLLESELLGYEAGAFTGAVKGKVGLLEIADKGTLLLDEISELPLNLQVKLLQVIQDRKFIRIGGTETRNVNIRIIAATNKDLKSMVREGRFREDLFYRINVIPIVIPPLRQRRQEVPHLLLHFVDKFNQKHTRIKQLSSKAIDILVNYDWPGNIRELENLVESLVVVSERDIIMPDDLPEHVRQQQGKIPVSLFEGYENISLSEAVEAFESKIILDVYKKCKSTIKTARILGVNQSTIARKLKKYGHKYAK
jgi:TyrR family helix-turn-helix protein/PAS domain S-box-containing protein